MDGFEKMEVLEKILGTKKFIQELLLALGEYESAENADYIARMWDINFETAKK